MNLEILFEDDYYVAVHKPHGLLVHRSSIAKDVEVFALQTLRDQLGLHVYPVHRIDRKTAGVLLFAKSPASAKAMGEIWEQGQVKKLYYAIVRGFFLEPILCEQALKNERGNWQEAATHFYPQIQYEINIPFNGFPTSRYSLVQCQPLTGRTHQIRRHLSHLNHPIIGDRPWGCNKQNKLFLELWSVDTMMLLACSLEFKHPYTQEELCIQTDFSEQMLRLLNLFEKNT